MQISKKGMSVKDLRRKVALLEKKVSDNKRLMLNLNIRPKIADKHLQLLLDSIAPNL